MIVNLEWNVYFEDVCTDTIKPFNIFAHRGFAADLQLILDNPYLLREEFEELVDGILHYYFWAKCEYEIILTCWPPDDKFKGIKVDVYNQIALNKEIFMDYLWSRAVPRKEGGLNLNLFRRNYCWECGDHTCAGPAHNKKCKYLHRYQEETE
jgi:hypothetical protein